MNPGKATGCSICLPYGTQVDDFKHRMVRGRRVRTTLRERKLMRWLATTNMHLLDMVAWCRSLERLNGTYVDENARLRALLENNGIGYKDC